jgi:hypothetical protein
MTHSHSKSSPPEPDTQSEECDSPPAAGDRSLVYLVLLGLSIPLYFIGDAIYDHFAKRQVVSSRPIGTLQRAVGSGGRFAYVLETESAFYPRMKPLATQKGAQLILEIRSNGARYVCSANRSACARTSDHELEQSVTPGQ